jgi:hypothetical protein
MAPEQTGGAASRPANLGEVRIDLAAPAAPDGYRPITDSMWSFGAIVEMPGLEEWRLLSAASRRLDTAHRHLETVRATLGATPPPEMSSIAGRRRIHEVVGDVETFVWALDKAIEIAKGLNGRYSIPVSFPAVVAQKEPLVASLRDHYSHIEERALGRVEGKPDPKAEEAFQSVSLVQDRKISDGTNVLGVDDQATELCIALRNYLKDAWGALVGRANEKARAAAANGL